MNFSLFRKQVHRMIKSSFATFQHGLCTVRAVVHLHSKILIRICARISFMHSPDWMHHRIRFVRWVIRAVSSNSNAVSVNWFDSIDPWQDLKDDWGKGGFERITKMRETYPHLKVSLAIGGWNEGSKNYSNLVAEPARRQRFVKSATDFVLKYRFDGLDLDWEYPTQRYVKAAPEVLWTQK